MNNQANLYADLPPRSYSMEEFISHSNTLFDMDTEEFIRFTLTGEVPGDHQAVVDPLRNFLNPAHQIFASRDYDSVIGITDDIAVDCPLTIYPVNNPADALRTSIHIKRSIEDGEVGISITFALKYWIDRGPPTENHIHPISQNSERKTWHVGQQTQHLHFFPSLGIRRGTISTAL